jgi:hypothetical protein
MGLDMYLNGRIYVGANYEHSNVTGSVNLKRNNQEIDIPLDKVVSVELDLGYWRKANAIHKYFIDNCADGNDDCSKVIIERSDLENLLDLCKKVSSHPFLAEELLPTQSGFFFGSTEYDDYYLDCIKDTIQIIEDALKYKNVDYVYSASW